MTLALFLDVNDEIISSSSSGRLEGIQAQDKATPKKKAEHRYFQRNESGVLNYRTLKIVLPLPFY
jgi:hypothetical protein